MLEYVKLDFPLLWDGVLEAELILTENHQKYVYCGREIPLSKALFQEFGNVLEWYHFENWKFEDREDGDWQFIFKEKGKRKRTIKGNGDCSELFGHVIRTFELFANNVCLQELDWLGARKSILESAKNVDREGKVVILAEVLGELRILFRWYRKNGECIWKYFDVPKEDMAKYYSEIQDELYELQRPDFIGTLYWEMVDIYKELFVTFLFAEDGDAIYQIGWDMTGHKLRKPTDEKAEHIWEEIDRIPTSATIIPRLLAEDIEDFWYPI